MKVNLKVNKLELLEWYLLNWVELTASQLNDCRNEDWLSFYNSAKKNPKQKEMLDTWFEVIEEPDYNSWIGEDCVFSDEAPDLNNIKKYICFLGVLTNYSKGENKNFRDNAYSWNYCMLKKDYVKLLKEQAK